MLSGKPAAAFPARQNANSVNHPKQQQQTWIVKHNKIQKRLVKPLVARLKSKWNKKETFPR
jgi:hypothetical protein